MAPKLFRIKLFFLCDENPTHIRRNAFFVEIKKITFLSVLDFSAKLMNQFSKFIYIIMKIIDIQ